MPTIPDLLLRSYTAMDTPARLHRLQTELRDELDRHILPYWMEKAVDRQRGGFVGRITQEGAVVPEAAKGGVLNARILWTFSAAYRLLGDGAYHETAERAFTYFDTHFWDAIHGGVFWSVDARGCPHERHKQIYAQAFALYGLAEYHRATGDAHALARALELFHLIEQHGFDERHGGYFEAHGRAWEPIEDMRLSAKDLNAPKSMNTHLHVLEAYTTLFLIRPDPLLRRRLHALIVLFLETILDPRSHHLHLFFNADWTVQPAAVSFGHDIEASWLLLEAARALGDPALRARVQEAAIAIARMVRQQGQDQDGGLFYERHPGGRLDDDKHWWPQAEALVGFLTAYRETGDPDFLAAAEKVWTFTRQFVIDPHGGEWFGRLTRAGKPYDGEDKVGLWKCPYHNARACLEGIARTAPLDAPDT